MDSSCPRLTAVRYWLRRPDEPAPRAQLLLAETVAFKARGDGPLPGTTVRIENSTRAHAEALGTQLTAYRTELVSHNGSWQLEVDLGELGPLLVQLFQALGEWLEDSSVDSLLLHFDDRQFTLLRPPKDRHS